MAKIPFSIDYRPQIESGEYKVVTGDDRPVRIISWDKKIFGGRIEIVGLVPTSQGDTETVQLYCPDGTLIASGWNEKFKLFIVTPEPELTEFEKNYIRIAHKMDPEEYNDEGLNVAKKEAAKLIELARREFFKHGYVIEKKAFHDAVEKIDDKHKAEMSMEYALHCKVENGTRQAVINWNEFQKVAQHFIDCGKAEALKKIEEDPESSYAFKRGVEYGKEEALKDLPRWKKCDANDIGWSIHTLSMRKETFLYHNGYIIDCQDLVKLPGFKED